MIGLNNLKTNKMTAVEFLEEIIYGEQEFSLSEVFEQAKEMEKQQIVDAFEIGYENGACVNENNDFYHGGNYYNETFKQKI
jgi:hypothetical protein